MDAAGLEVHPKLTIGGAYEFNDVFLDGVVLEPSQVLGTVGQGWLVAMSGLEVERFGVGGNVLLLDLLLADLVSVARAIQVDGARALDSLDLRRDLAALQSDAAAARAFVDDHVERTLRDADVPADASIAKVLYSETYNAIARYGAGLIAEHAPVPNVVQLEAQRLIDAWLWSRALTISGGSSEVMRNIIAKRRLRLPQ
jgi:alkylation response protein AidB-like acyl-CoA dehydrogenase